MLILRPTTSDDLAAVVTIEAAPDTAAWLSTTGLAWHQDALADADLDHVVVEHDGVLTGFAVLAGLTTGDGVVEVRRMVLAPMVRGAGLGRALVQAAVGRAYDRHGASRVWLDVKAHNDRARFLYASEGFTETERVAAAVTETDGTTSDLVVMVHRPND